RLARLVAGWKGDRLRTSGSAPNEYLISRPLRDGCDECRWQPAAAAGSQFIRRARLVAGWKGDRFPTSSWALHEDLFRPLRDRRDTCRWQWTANTHQGRQLLARLAATSSKRLMRDRTRTAVGMFP